MPFVPDKPAASRFVPDAQPAPATAKTYPGRNAESSAASPAYKEPSFMDRVMAELKNIPSLALGHAENVASIATGIPASLAGGIGYAAGLTTGDPGFASEMQGKLGGWAYQPRTPEGQAEQAVIGKVLSAPSRLSEAVADKDFERNNAQGDPAAAAKATALRVAPEALMMVLGGKAGANAAPTVKPKLNLNDKPAGLGALLTGNVEKIAGNNVRAIAGPQAAREQLAAALMSAKPPVKGFPMTAADAVRGTDAGTTIQALQERVARSVTNSPDSKLGVSQQFERRAREQKGAIAEAERQRNALTEKMRNIAVKKARTENSVTANTEAKIRELSDTEKKFFESKAYALQDKGRFDTTVGEQTRRSLFKDENMGPVAEKLGLQRPALPTPSMATGATPRPPARYTPQAARAEEAAAASSEMPPIIELRQKQMEGAAAKKAALEGKDLNGIRGGTFLSQIDRLQNSPAMRGSRVAGQTLNSLREHVASLVDENGLIDPEAAYSVRKEIGTFIDNAIPSDPASKAKWDKSMTGKAMRESVQSAIDSELDAASGGRWTPYINTYSRLSQKIDKAKDMVDNKYSVNQKSDVASVHGQAENSATHFPSMLSRPAAIARHLLESRRKGIEGDIASKQAQWLQNPTMLAAQLQKGISPQEQMIAAALAAAREARLKALAAGGGAAATQSQEKR